MTAEEIVASIHKEFPAQIWPKDKLAANKECGCLDCQYIIEHFQGKAWDELSEQELGWMSQDSWAFSDEAVLFFLPAWLVCDVKLGSEAAWHFEKLAYQLSDEQFAKFSQVQRKVMYEAVLFAYPEIQELDLRDASTRAASAFNPR